MKPPHDPDQTSQRLRVGLIGLAAVVLLIGLASAIIGSATRVVAPANGSTEIALNLVAGNEVAAAGEPLAELGAAPGTPSTSNGIIEPR